MGQNQLKQSASKRYNFSLYGLTPEEGAELEKNFMKAAGMDRKLNKKEFKKLYLKLNPKSKHDHVLKLFNSIFQNEAITFDKFLGFYFKFKSSPENIQLIDHTSDVPYSPAGIEKKMFVNCSYDY
jgi:Ca2+-binding EF-hand superfamily protein